MRDTMRKVPKGTEDDQDNESVSTELSLQPVTTQNGQTDAVKTPDDSQQELASNPWANASGKDKDATDAPAAAQPVRKKKTVKKKAGAAAAAAANGSINGGESKDDVDKTPIKDTSTKSSEMVPDAPMSPISPVRSSSEGRGKRSGQSPDPPSFGKALEVLPTNHEYVPPKPTPQSPPQPQFQPIQNPFTANRSIPSRPFRPSGPPPTIVVPRFTPSTKPPNLYQKVVVITHGASPTGSSVVRHLHTAGARVIFGSSDPTAAAALVRSLGPPPTVNFNTCDYRRYDDLLALFKLAKTMYGRVDHAIFLSDDGGDGLIAQGEKGWLETKTRSLKDVDHEPSASELGGTLAAAVRFAHIAVAYLKHTAVPKKKPEHRRSRASFGGFGSIFGNDGESRADSQQQQDDDKSLTFVSSIAGFIDMPGLPIYQVTQHGVIGLVRSLRTSLEGEGIRINAICPGMMVARTVGEVGMRMSVKLPHDEPEDVGRVIIGAVCAGPSTGSGISYPRLVKKGEDTPAVVESLDGQHWKEQRSYGLHGRIIYVSSGECWDIEESLEKSRQIWLGDKASDMLRSAQDGVGKQTQWILDVV